MSTAIERAEQMRQVAKLETKLRATTKHRKGFRCVEQGRIALAYYRGTPRNVLGIMPTGMGKSLCYVFPTYLWAREESRALTVVVSPLIALMQDQVDMVERYNDTFPDFGLKVRQLNSSVAPDEQRRVRRDVRAHKVNLLLLGPEALVKPWTYEMLAEAARNGALRGLVVDEAHMIVEWGDQFRTAFKRMGAVRRYLQEAMPGDSVLRTLVLTATLPDRERREVFQALGVEPHDANFTSIEHRAIRSEHFLRVKHFRNHGEKLRDLLRDIKRLRKTGPGIVYCARRRHCEEIENLVSENGLGPIHHFHGGTNGIRRREILRAFRTSTRMIIAATDAFGLGVDKQDVRWVLHYSIPDSIEQYYQEIGRGGRDGKRCEALLYYCPADKGVAKKNALSVLTVEKVDERLRAMRREAIILRKHRGGNILLYEEETLPGYVQSPNEARDNAATMRLHQHWNYAALLRADQLGSLTIGLDVLNEVTCQLAPRTTRQQLKQVAPTLESVGLLGSLRIDRPSKLRFGVTAAKKGTDILHLQREFFDLLQANKIRLLHGPNVWNTRVMVEERTLHHVSRVEEDERYRSARQQTDAREVDRLGEYARAKHCRGRYFYQAFGYGDLFPDRGCGRCDVCAPGFQRIVS